MRGHSILLLSYTSITLCMPRIMRTWAIICMIWSWISQNFGIGLRLGLWRMSMCVCSWGGGITMCTSQNFGVGLLGLLPQCIRCTMPLFSVVSGISGAIAWPVVSVATVNANGRALSWGPTHVSSMFVIVTCSTKVIMWAVLSPVHVLSTCCALDAWPTWSQVPWIKICSWYTAFTLRCTWMECSILWRLFLTFFTLTFTLITVLSLSVIISYLIVIQLTLDSLILVCVSWRCSVHTSWWCMFLGDKGGVVCVPVPVCSFQEMFVLLWWHL